ncbi:MAG: hypothetical protein IPH28_25325 [Cytophagaceae bacterium]|nr:hypothetical protein [Cytophagaceae bacterium]
MSLGFTASSLGFVVIEFAVKGLQPATKVSMFFLIAMYFLHTIGELCLSPIGLSLVYKLSPQKYFDDGCKGF